MGMHAFFSWILQKDKKYVHVDVDEREEEGVKEQVSKA